MIAIYVTSVVPFSGKSAICIGLGHQLQQRGLSIGYIKPISTMLKETEQGEFDEDALVAKQAFELTEDLDTIAPIHLNDFTIERIFDEEELPFQENLKRAYATIAEGKDVVLIEGANKIAEGSVIGLPAPVVARTLAARALIIAGYEDPLIVDKILHTCSQHGEAVAGVIINEVPSASLDFVKERLVPFLNNRGIKVFGVIPRKKVLSAVSVAELAAGLGGELLCCHDRDSELVEDLSIGAMTSDSALAYFRRRANKAVITGGDRPDIQLAALETSTKCLILTGNLHPSPLILGRAEELDVPVMLVKHDTLTTVSKARQIFDNSHFHHLKKIQRFERLLEEHLNFDELYRELGIK